MTSNQKVSRPEETHQFHIQATLAQFATCTLYDATLADDTAVFLLQLLPAKSENAVLTSEFLQRVSIISQIDHPNIAPVLASGLTEDQHAYAILQKVGNQTLAGQLDEFVNDTAVSQIQFTHQIASALAVAHEKDLIHHHLAPQNIYLTENGAPYLVDLAVPVVPTTAIKSETPITRLDYRPPEQREGKPLTPAANVYSLGVILYTLLAGDAPHLPSSDWDIYDYREIPREVPLEQVRTGLSEATYTLVQTCIWQREWDRYQSMSEVIEAMDTAVSAEKRTKTLPPTAKLTQSKLPTNWIVLAALLIFILCLGVFFVGRSLLADDANSAVAPPIAPTDTTTPTQTSQSQSIENNDPTATPTNSITASATTTPTNTNTPTATATSTATPTTTNTPTPEPTTTDTATPTATPTEAQACEPAPPFGWVRYTIQANDTLSELATLGNTTTTRIQEVNCLEGNILSIGQALWLPASVLPTDTPTPVPATATENPPPGGGNSSGGGSNPPSQPDPTSPPKATIPPPPEP